MVWRAAWGLGLSCCKSGVVVLKHSAIQRLMPKIKQQTISVSILKSILLILTAAVTLCTALAQN